MEIDFIDPKILLLFLLAFPAGLSSSWLGAGASVFIVPLLPVLFHLDPLGSLQVSLLIMLVFSFINSVSFYFQKLILWSWCIEGVKFVVLFSFLGGVFVSHLNPFQVRFILWCFLSVIVVLPWILAYIPFIKTKGLYVFSALAGICTGFTGLGGGMILSPFLHESQLIPAKNIPALVSCILFCVSICSLLGQISQKGFLFIQSPEVLSVFYKLLIPYLMGTLCGYIVNLKQKNINLRKKVVRILVLSMFLKMTHELWF